jgi:hypothetical protein
MTKDESRKEIERLERLLETEKYIREQERKGAEYDKEIIKDNNSKTIGYLAGFLLMAVMIIWGLMGGK